MEQFNLDAIDLHLLDLLQRDASISNQVLAKLACDASSACMRRV
jgi:Lrp/AsnC family leucine-responsive transcriptional regulator